MQFDDLHCEGHFRGHCYCIENLGFIILLSFWIWNSQTSKENQSKILGRVKFEGMYQRPAESRSSV